MLILCTKIVFATLTTTIILHDHVFITLGVAFLKASLSKSKSGGGGTHTVASKGSKSFEYSSCSLSHSTATEKKFGVRFCIELPLRNCGMLIYRNIYLPGFLKTRSL